MFSLIRDQFIEWSAGALISAWNIKHLSGGKTWIQYASAKFVFWTSVDLYNT